MRDEAEWQRWWRRLDASAAGDVSLPRVDFATESVIVAALGERLSSGHGIAIDSVLQVGDTLRVVVTTLEVARDCPSSPGVLAPAHAVAVSSTLANVRFIERTALVDRCGLGPRRPS